MVSCVSCGTSKTPDNNKKGITFHRFPKNVVVREQWLKFVGAQRQISENAVLCSKHFSPLNFDKTSQAVTRLKISSIPTIHVNRIKCVRQLNSETFVASSSANIEASSTLEAQFMVGPSSSPVAEAAGPFKVFSESQSGLCEGEASCSVAGPSNVNVSSKFLITPTSSIVSQEGDTPMKKGLKRKIRRLKTERKMQSYRIKNLQQRNWRLRKRVSNLKSLIQDLLPKKRTAFRTKNK